MKGDKPEKRKGITVIEKKASGIVLHQGPRDAIQYSPNTTCNTSKQTPPNKLEAHAEEIYNDITFATIGHEEVILPTKADQKGRSLGRVRQ